MYVMCVPREHVHVVDVFHLWDHIHTSYMTSHTVHEDRLASIFQFSNLKGICWQDSEMLRAGPPAFVHEILDGNAAKPGGDYIPR